MGDSISSVVIVPILVGSINRRKEVEYGQLLSRYVADPENFFVISSDFCHWGRRYFKKKGGVVLHVFEKLRAEQY